MQNKRRFKRFTLKVLEIHGRMIAATEVKVVDISIGGIRLKANRRLNIGNEYALKLESVDKVISLKGVVVWSSLSDNTEGAHGEVVPIYTAGLKFTNISASQITQLLEFIEMHMKEEIYVMGSSRLNVRFHINDPEKAILNYPASYKVRKISLGGMLIECVQSLEVESRIPMELSLREDNPLKFVGRIASCQVMEDSDPKQYAIGIEFLGLTKKDNETLATFVEYCAAIEEGSEG
jgi:c-di-GMP-binding flagellar brake protein YcgR